MEVLVEWVPVCTLTELMASIWGNFQLVSRLKYAYFYHEGC